MAATKSLKADAAPAHDTSAAFSVWYVAARATLNRLRKEAEAYAAEAEDGGLAGLVTDPDQLGQFAGGLSDLDGRLNDALWG